MRLTDMTIKSLPAPEKGARIYTDQIVSGFGVRVSQGGTKSFVLTHGVRHQRETIGRVGIVTLQEARAEAMRTTPDFILSQPRLQFACHIRNVTQQAVSIPVEWGVLERQRQLSQKEYQVLRELNRDRVSLPDEASPSKSSISPEPVVGHSPGQRHIDDDVTKPSADW